MLAACKKLVKNVVIGGMANQRVNGNGFSQPCKIAHKHILLADAADGCGASPIDCRPAMEKPLCQRSQAGEAYRIVIRGSVSYSVSWLGDGPLTRLLCVRRLFIFRSRANGNISLR